MKLIVRMETSFTITSSLLMLAAIFSTMPGHSPRGISMTQIAATTYVIVFIRWQLLS